MVRTWRCSTRPKACPTDLLQDMLLIACEHACWVLLCVEPPSHQSCDARPYHFTKQRLRNHNGTGCESQVALLCDNRLHLYDLCRCIKTCHVQCGYAGPTRMFEVARVRAQGSSGTTLKESKRPSVRPAHRTQFPQLDVTSSDNTSGRGVQDWERCTTRRAALQINTLISKPQAPRPVCPNTLQLLEIPSALSTEGQIGGTVDPTLQTIPSPKLRGK